MTGPAGHQPSILMSWGGEEFNVSWALKISAHYALRYNLVGYDWLDDGYDWLADMKLY